MGGFSIWHWVVIMMLIMPIALAFFVKAPAGANRYGPPAESKSFFDAVQTVFGKFFDFSGRASRSEYWYFWLFQVIASFLAGLARGFVPDLLIPVFLFQLGLSLPFFALTARRLHDGNRSGWWQLLYLTGVGGITIFIWTLMKPKDDFSIADGQ